VPEFDVELLGNLVSIILIDLVLSGDNAVVIGMAARRLSPESRRRAIVLGGAAAVVLRIIFTAMAAILLDVPLLEALGGIALLFIAYRLLKPQSHAETISEAESMSQAIRTIIAADVVMSLDNILAVGGAAHGNLWLLLFGLALSIPLLLVGSDLVARLLGRLPVLVYIGAIVLIITAVRMVFGDHVVRDNIVDLNALEIAGVSLVLSALIIFLSRRAARGLEPAAAAEWEVTRVVLDGQPDPSESS
jgi:YjbE family integral membrane protein